MLFASNNLNKVLEVENILNRKILSLKDLDFKINVLETGKTFNENAIIKAKEIYELTKIPTIAEDSGLEIPILNGFPGVKTNRFLGSNKTDSDRNQKILEMMQDKNDRTCYFTSCFAYYDGKNLQTFTSSLKGTIAYEEHINMGFGFDSIFLYNNEYLSNMSISNKNKISPRTSSLKKLQDFLQKNIDLID